MLEGHFVDVMLAPEWRVAGHPVYDVWLYVRGMTAPMFFSVTGLIFAYLLSGAAEPGFWRVKRVRRGLLRAVELLAWGYALQVDFRLLPGVFRGEWDPWLQAFHVLQCIGVGLLGMLGVFGLVRRAGPRVLAAGYVVAGLGMFLLGVALARQAGPVPEWAPAWLQNGVKGPFSMFPVAPWLGYTCYGAAVGVLVRYRSGGRDGTVGAAAFLGSGLFLKLAGGPLDQMLAGLLPHGPGAAGGMPLDAFHGRVGEILMVLGVLVWIENRFHPRWDWFQVIGRNTFPIYIGHVVVLYGGIFGVSLQHWLGRSLNPWQAGLGAVVFCGVFGWCARWVEPVAGWWRAWREARS